MFSTKSGSCSFLPGRPQDCVCDVTEQFCFLTTQFIIMWHIAEMCLQVPRNPAGQEQYASVRQPADLCSITHAMYGTAESDVSRTMSARTKQYETLPLMPWYCALQTWPDRKRDLPSRRLSWPPVWIPIALFSVHNGTVIIKQCVISCTQICKLLDSN